MRTSLAALPEPRPSSRLSVAAAGSMLASRNYTVCGASAGPPTSTSLTGRSSDSAREMNDRGSAQDVSGITGGRGDMGLEGLHFCFRRSNRFREFNDEKIRASMRREGSYSVLD